MGQTLVLYAFFSDSAFEAARQEDPKSCSVTRPLRNAARNGPHPSSDGGGELRDTAKVRKKGKRKCFYASREISIRELNRSSAGPTATGDVAHTRKINGCFKQFTPRFLCWAHGLLNHGIDTAFSQARSIACCMAVVTGRSYQPKRR